MKRASDDSALPSELREALARSRAAGHDYDTLGKLPQLKAALAAAQANAYDPLAEPAPRLDAAASRIPAATWKLMLIAAAVGASLYAMWPAPERAEVPAAPPRAVQPIDPQVAAQPTLPAPEPEAAKSNAPGLGPEVVKPIAPAPGPDQVAPSVQRDSRREIAQLVRIRELLPRDPAAAYRLAVRSDAEFPRGVLREERRALQIVALAKRGSMAAAEKRGQAFFEQYPQSPLRDLVEAALAR